MKHIGFIIAICLYLISCTQVELCDVSLHPHQYELNVTYNWPTDLAEEDRPDSMYIVGNRLFKNIRYQFSYNLLTEEGRLMKFWESKKSQTNNTTVALSRNGSESEEETDNGTDNETDSGNGETTNDNEENAEDDSTASEEESTEPEEEVQPLTDFSIRSGQYQMLTFNHTSSIIVDSLDRYMTDNRVKSTSLGLSYHLYDYPQYKGKAYTHWTDFNKGYQYIENVGPLLMAQQTVDTENQQRINLNFTPEVLTQEITFNFSIQLSDRDIVVDSVRAEVSGVSRYVKLFSRYIDMDATRSCRMIFDAIPATMTADMQVACTGKVHVAGMMNSEDETMKTGPGLLFIAAYVHTTDDNGNIIKKTCYAGINLRSYILEQPLTQLTEDGYHHTISQPKVTIHIESLLPISKEEILGITHPEENIEYWFKEEGGKGDYDLEV